MGRSCSARDPPRNLQDPLCFRNVPQIHAAARHALAHAERIVETELAPAPTTRRSSLDSGASSSTVTTTSRR